MNMAEVFEHQVMKVTEDKMHRSFERLKHDEALKRKIRELSHATRNLQRLNKAISPLSGNNDLPRDWVIKRDELRIDCKNTYVELNSQGFEDWWITTIVNHELEKLDLLYKETRDKAYIEAFGKLEIKDIDILDDRWELVEQQIEQMKTNYLMGR
ncbi:hypothetical protein [Bacillus sp. CGMCC 1.16541]|uniref:hypothetical protein n=1 Tax=Bacillus sp. CGMCC 1.16541 TaxID=2185143 RepID=UPI000D727697|nr:hypothetical protein [Bacillus sp. CGMCC 1.16541]